MGRAQSSHRRGQTLGAVAERCRATLVASGRRPRTLEAFDGSVAVLLRFWRPVIPVADVTQESIETFANARRVGPPAASNATLRRDLGVLRTLLRRAVALGWLPRLPTFPRIPLPRPAPVVLTAGQVEQLLAGAGRLRPLMLVALHTGLRAGELRRLVWSDVRDLNDASAAHLHVSAESKTWSARLVPLNGPARSSLLGLQRGKPTSLVFVTRDGTPWSTSALSEAARSAVDRAGLGHLKGLKPLHSLRATWASRALDRGASPQAVLEVGGWRSGLAILTHYAKASGRSQRRAVELVEAE